MPSITAWVRTHSFVLTENGATDLHIRGRKVNIAECSALTGRAVISPSNVDMSSLDMFLKQLESMRICEGCPRQCMIDMCRHALQALNEARVLVIGR